MLGYFICVIIMNVNGDKFFLVKVVYVLFFVVILFFVSQETKKELHLDINAYHSSFFDTFFKYITYLGDGIMFGVFIVLSFFRNKLLSLTFAVSGLLTLVLAQFFKKVVFRGTPRPIELIGGDSLHLVKGVEMAHWNSFPSGHTTTVFAIATVLILQIQNKWVQLLLLLLAMLVGFSRVYLSQHFMADILAGSLLGIIIGVISLKFTELIVKKRIY